MTTFEIAMSVLDQHSKRETRTHDSDAPHETNLSPAPPLPLEPARAEPDYYQDVAKDLCLLAKRALERDPVLTSAVRLLGGSGVQVFPQISFVVLEQAWPLALDGKVAHA